MLKGKEQRFVSKLIKSNNNSRLNGGQTLQELTLLSMAEQLVSVARILAEILWHCLAAVLENHLLYTLTKTDFEGIALPVVPFRPVYHAFVAVRQLHLGFPLTFCLA